MYNSERISLLYPNGTQGALSNICHGNGYNKFSTVMDLRDAVEDSKTAVQLVNNLRNLCLIGMDNMTIDRNTSAYTRIKGIDRLGNIRYLKVEKENDE